MTFKITLKDILYDSIVSMRKSDDSKVYTDRELTYQLRYAIREMNPDINPDKLFEMVSSEIDKIERFYSEYINTHGLNKFPDAISYSYGNFTLVVYIKNNFLLKNLIPYKEKDNQTQLFGN